MRTFNEYIAADKGLYVAVMLDNLYTQISNYAQQGINVIDGKVWLNLSVKDWQYQIGFMSVSKIRRVLDLLSDEGFIEIGEFNSSQLNKTKWYSITKDGLSYLAKYGYDVTALKICNGDVVVVEEDKPKRIKTSSKTVKTSKPVPKTRRTVDKIPDETENFRKEVYTEKNTETYGKPFLDSFFDYWSQPAENYGKRTSHILRYVQKGWDVGKRLAKWNPPKNASKVVATTAPPPKTEAETKKIINVPAEYIRKFEELKAKNITNSIWIKAMQLVSLTDEHVVINFPTRTAYEVFCETENGKNFFVVVAQSLKRNVDFNFGGEYITSNETG